MTLAHPGSARSQDGASRARALEVFDDVFRQADPRRTAVDARRSLLVLQDSAAHRRARLRRGGR